jgi:hypothetical protein
MEIAIKENMLMVELMERVYILGHMVKCMMANGIRV